jgi:cytochrome c-type biogenesis protein CcmH
MQPRRSIQFLLTFALLLTLATTVGAPILAQDGTSSDVTADDVNDVARELWCPLCSGVRLDSCELKACDQMKDEIAIKLADGEDLDSIKQYFVNQYGPQVLGEPPREGFNLLAWVLPVLVMLGGGIFLVTRGRNMLRREDPAVQPGAAAATGTGAAAEAEPDPYSQRLDEELKAYD